MSRITTYPKITEISPEDLLVISDVSTPYTSTRTVTVQDLVGGSTAPLALTTFGTSGAATLINNVLNVPNYGSGTMSSWTAGAGGEGGFEVSDEELVSFIGGTKLSSSATSGTSSITFDHNPTTRTDTTSTAAPGSDGTFTVIDSITQDSTGHTIAVNVKTVTMPTTGGGGGMTQWIVDDGGMGGFPVQQNDAVAVQGSAKIDVTTSTQYKSITWTHADTTRTDTTSTAAPAAGATFTVIDSITQDATGHPTAVNVKTVTMPAGGGGGTTYDLASAQDGDNVDITLTPATGTVDTVQLTAGTNITLTDNGNNNITIDAAGGGGGGGVSSIGLSTDITAFTILNSPITTAGTLQINKNGGLAGQYLNQDGTWQYGIFKKDANDGIYVSDRTVANYGTIGANSFDASFSTNATGVNGAVGDHSAAFGENNKVTQDWAFVTGRTNELSTAKYSFMFGKENTSNAASSIIGGWENYVNVTTQTDYHSLVVLGNSNIVSTPAIGAAVIGKNNVANSGFSGCMFGTTNQANASRTYIFGSDNTIGSSTGSSVMGYGNNLILGNQATIVGNGNSADNATHDSQRNAIFGYDISVSANGIIAIGDTMDCTVADAVYIGSSQAHGGNVGTTRVIMPSIANMASFANDTAAAAGGVAVGELYRDGSTIKIRVT